MNTLISNVTVVTMNTHMEVLFDAYISITDGKITAITKKTPKEQPETIIDGTGMVAMPGLVNCHSHLSETILRNLLDDLGNREALETLLKMKDRMDHRSAKSSALLGITECLRFGITSVSDLSEQPLAVAEAAAETGIKANIAPALQRFEDENEPFDFETDPSCRGLVELAERWNGYDDGRILVDCGIYAEYTSNYPLWESLAAYADEKGLGMQLHLAQQPEEVDSCVERTGLTPTELLDCHRLFAVPASAAGCGGLTEAEGKYLGKRGASAVVLPIADGKAGRASADVGSLVRAGVNVALGTDGAANGGNQDLFEAMRAVVNRERRAGKDAAVFPAQAALLMATVCGAKAQRRSKQCGILEVGMDADIILVDFTAPHLTPCHNVLNGLVFSATGCDVAMTMVRGKPLYQNGKFTTIDTLAMMNELTGYAIPRLQSDKT